MFKWLYTVDRNGGNLAVLPATVEANLVDDCISRIDDPADQMMGRTENEEHYENAHRADTIDDAVHVVGSFWDRGAGQRPYSPRMLSLRVCRLSSRSLSSCACKTAPSGV